jgi:hypothetical protein
MIDKQQWVEVVKRNYFGSFTVFTEQRQKEKNDHCKAKQFSKTRAIQPDVHRLSESHALLDLGNGKSRVQALGASPAAVEDGVATVQAHAVVEAVHTLGSLLVTRVGDPAVRLHEYGGAEVLLAVPPV